MWLSWVLWLRVSHKVVINVSAGAVASSEDLAVAESASDTLLWLPAHDSVPRWL